MPLGLSIDDTEPRDTGTESCLPSLRLSSEPIVAATARLHGTHLQDLCLKY